MSVICVAGESAESLHCAWWGNLLFYLFIVLCLHFSFSMNTVPSFVPVFVGVWIAAVCVLFFLFFCLFGYFFFFFFFQILCEQHQVLHSPFLMGLCKSYKCNIFVFKCICLFKLFIFVFCCLLILFRLGLYGFFTQRVWEWWVGWCVGIFHLTNDPKTNDRQVMKSSLGSICGFCLN